MKKLNFVVSLTTNDNDYQMEQAAAAAEAAVRLGAGVQILYADNDSIQQSQQLLRIIQSSADARPDAIIFEPAGGTALPQVARAAVTAGIGWVVLNRDVDYVFELRQARRVPVFALSSDHEEIGRIQGRQLSALLPGGGCALCIHGPSDSLAARQRAVGMDESKPAEVQLKPMKGQWTEASAYHAIGSWLRLSTSRQSHIDVIAAQNDAMAVGARKAFEELTDEATRARWLSLPYVGVDGLPKTGLAWVKNGLLAATIIVPPNSGQAVEMLVKSIRGGSTPPERTLTVPESFPSIERLNTARAEKTRVVYAGRV
jgi:ribose transport system substrate-binding protein